MIGVTKPAYRGVGSPGACITGHILISVVKRLLPFVWVASRSRSHIWNCTSNAQTCSQDKGDVGERSQTNGSESTSVQSGNLLLKPIPDHLELYEGNSPPVVVIRW